MQFETFSLFKLQ